MSKQRGRAGDISPARPSTGIQRKPAGEEAGPETLPNDGLREETKVMASYGSRAQAPMEGVTVIGEAVRRASPEGAEFLIEITSSAPVAAQALQDNQVKTAQVAQAVSSLGVQQSDFQTISLNVYNLYAPVVPALPAFGSLPQIGAGSFRAGAAGMQVELQSAMYHARNTLRVNVRDVRRLGEIVDTVARAGAAVLGSLSIRAQDEAAARRTALEAAGKDARAKAEALAGSAGKQVGDAISIAEEIVVTNGAYAAIRSAIPFAFGAGAPQFAGELEYYARVTASFRLQ
jgi:uncharacterized protein YggE